MPEPAPRQLILSLYGLYARDEHNWLSVSAVVRLMGDLGVDSAGVRSSISRLKRRGVLQRDEDGRRGRLRAVRRMRSSCCARATSASSPDSARSSPTVW